MPLSNINVPVVFHLIFLMTGSAGNLFILSVHFLDWLKSRKISSCDLIINCIVIINLMLQGSITFHQICFYMFVEFFIQVWVVNSLGVIITSLAFSSLWCSTCLCFCYCVKIISINGMVFYKLKAKLPKMVPWLLVFSNVISWAAGLPTYWDIHKDADVSTSNITSNMLTIHLNYNSRCNCLFPMYMSLSTVAFVIISMTAGAIITSLCKHMIRFKNNNEGSRSGRLSSHVTAARTVTSLLILFVIFYGAMNIVYNEAQDPKSVILVASLLVCSSFSTVNAIILINGNRKLSNMWRHLLGMKSAAGNTEVTVVTN